MTGSSVDADTWVRRFHVARPDAPRLVCFPHAGGSASFFFPVSTALLPTTQVVAVQYPGRQDRLRESPLTDLTALAAGVFQALRPSLSATDWFFGHSMGASLAFEVALLMEHQLGVPPAGVIVSGRRAPSRFREESVHRRDDNGLVAEMRRLGGTDTSLLGDEDVARMVLPAVRADYQAIETYRPDRVDVLGCPIEVFTGTADPLVDAAEAAAWRDHTRAGARVRTFPGGHFYLTERPGEVIAAVGDVLAAGTRR